MECIARYLEEAVAEAQKQKERLEQAAGREAARCRALLSEESAQGTTEYAILVGVLVVIAIIAIIAFRDKVSALWNAISDGINSL